METNINNKPIREINNLHKDDLINLKPDYQRKPVWSFKEKVYLIDTILQGLPIPKFFFNLTIRDGIDENAEDDMIYDIIDGQQRLTAIFEFMDGKTTGGKKFVLSKKQHPKPKTFLNRVEGLTYKTLPKELREGFWKYKLSFEELINPTKIEINDMFIRLNLGGMKIVPQELRNASFFENDFKDMVYETSKKYEDYFLKNKILNKTMVSRSIDAEFVSELYTAMLLGLQDKKKKLDDVYHNNEKMEIDDVNELKKKFKFIIKIITDIFGDNLKTTKFNSKMNFYSLFYVIYDLSIKKNYKISRQIYSDIYKALIKLNQNIIIESKNDDMAKYASVLQQGGDTEKNREFKHDILFNVLEPFCIKRDLKRLFSEDDKQFLWHSVDEKVCGICNEIIKDYDDCEIDHIISYSEGGYTTINNGQISHSLCNRSKGNRSTLNIQ